jgi:hypothetical protein
MKKWKACCVLLCLSPQSRLDARVLVSKITVIGHHGFVVGRRAEWQLCVSRAFFLV